MGVLGKGPTRAHFLWVPFVPGPGYGVDGFSEHGFLIYPARQAVRVAASVVLGVADDLVQFLRGTGIGSTHDGGPKKGPPPCQDGNRPQIRPYRGEELFPHASLRQTRKS